MNYVIVASNLEHILIITDCFLVCVATSQDVLPGASPDQADVWSFMPSSMSHHFTTFTRSKSRSSLEMKFPSPLSQPQPDMVPDFDHQQQISPQVCY
jgi:hypothetical protein